MMVCLLRVVWCDVSFALGLLFLEDYYGRVTGNVP
jgi:hypothetical protein